MKPFAVTTTDVGVPVLENATQILGGKWAFVILSHLLAGPLSPAEIRRYIPSIYPSVLSRNVRILEENGLVECIEGDEETQISITPLGRTLEPIILAIQDWAERYESYRSSTSDMTPVYIYERRPAKTIEHVAIPQASRPKAC